MSEQKHLLLITEIPDRDLGQAKAHRDFMDYLTLVLRYEHSELVDEAAEVVQKKTHAALYAALRKSFFQDLYVDRLERNELHNWLHTNWASIVTGQIGSGKTTILLKLTEEAAKSSSNLIYYIDLSKQFSVLDQYDQYLIIHNEQTTAKASTHDLLDPVDIPPYVHDVCSTIVNYMILKTRSLVPNLDREYGLYKILHHPIYSRICESIRQNENPKTADDWWNALSHDYKKWKIETDQINNYDKSIDLETFLSFLKETLVDKQIIVVIDNIDRYSINLQRSVFTKSLSLSKKELAKLILAFRAHNLRVVRHEGEHGEVYHIANVDIQVPSDVGVADLKVTADLVKEYIRKRINYLKNYNIDIVRRDKYGELYGKEFNLAYEPFADMFWSLFNEAIYGQSGDEVVGNFGEWCNGSLRNLSIHVARYFAAIVLGDDVPYSLKSIIKRDSPFRIDKRALRTYAYKRMICADNLIYDGKTCINIFNPLGSIANDREIYYLELKLLSYIQRRNGSCKYGDILSSFAKCNIERNNVFNGLYRLKNARTKEERGYVYIDKREDKIDENMDNDTLIILMPSAEFFLTTLCCSCEYLFWCSLDCELPYTLSAFEGLGGHAIAAFRLVQEDTFKVQCAVEFFCKSLVPNFRKEIISINKHYKESTLSMDILSFMGYFNLEDRHYSLKISASLRKFLSDRIDKNTRIRMTAMLDKAEKELEGFTL